MSTTIPRVRLISQDSSLLVRLTGLLIDAGFDVSASFDADDALPFIAHAHPAVVLFDQRLPGGDTLELLQRIKDLSPETRIVLLSARTDWACYEEVLQRNGDSICPRRPLQPLVVLHAIERAMSATGTG
jgi:DNA-binding NarL/FixJ family response regulator